MRTTAKCRRTRAVVTITALDRLRRVESRLMELQTYLDGTYGGDVTMMYTLKAVIEDLRLVRKFF